jgi:acetolactate synthase-1/3 small subunit
MLELTGSSSKIEGLIQVITESGYTILEVSRTGRMAMRRGHHTSRVMKALGTPDPTDTNQATFPEKSGTDEVLPTEFTEDET